MKRIRNILILISCLSFSNIIFAEPIMDLKNNIIECDTTTVDNLKFIKLEDFCNITNTKFNIIDNSNLIEVKNDKITSVFHSTTIGKNKYVKFNDILNLKLYVELSDGYILKITNNTIPQNLKSNNDKTVGDGKMEDVKKESQETINLDKETQERQEKFKKSKEEYEDFLKIKF